jgi:hypothetical protein
MFKGLDIRKSRISEMSCPYHGRIEAIEDAVNNINSTCCSQTHMEQRVKTNVLLEELIKSVSALKSDIVNSEEKTKSELLEHIESLKSSQEALSLAHETYKKYLHYAMGALTIFYFLGFDQKIKSILMSAGG